MILDAKDLIVGRFATVAAKKALLGEKVDIVNCEKAVVTGRKDMVIEKFRNRRGRGVPLQGPYYPRTPDRLVRRMVRGMLPYKQPRGRDAFKRIMCYTGVPPAFREPETIESANIRKLPNVKYVTIGQITKELGAK